jgi:hypothetical protein
VQLEKNIQNIDKHSAQKVGSTTGNEPFAECPKNSAKKARQTVHRQSLLCRVLFLGHLAKRFAECQGALGKEKWSLRRRGNGDGFFAECQTWHSAKASPLLNVYPEALGKEYIFAECHLGHSAKNPPGRVPMSGSLPSALRGTRQSLPLCRVPAT